jgi:hypothetical protein
VCRNGVTRDTAYDVIAIGMQESVFGVSAEDRKLMESEVDIDDDDDDDEDEDGSSSGGGGGSASGGSGGDASQAHAAASFANAKDTLDVRAMRVRAKQQGETIGDIIARQMSAEDENDPHARSSNADTHTHDAKTGATRPENVSLLTTAEDGVESTRYDMPSQNAAKQPGSVRFMNRLAKLSTSSGASSSASGNAAKGDGGANNSGSTSGLAGSAITTVSGDASGEAGGHGGDASGDAGGRVGEAAPAAVGGWGSLLVDKIDRGCTEYIKKTVQQHLGSEYRCDTCTVAAMLLPSAQVLLHGICCCRVLSCC